jgi:acetyltransferase-like isoleucine patch superfamily enzyme
MPIKNSKIHKSVLITNKKLVNIYGCQIKENTKVGPFVEIQKNVTIGKNCKISSHSFICSGVKIANNVFIGHNVVFINDRNPASVNIKGKLKNDNDWKLEKTIIEEGSSIGSSSVIMCGIKIGKNSIIGAGSLVLKNVPSNTKYINKRKVVKVKK